MSEALDAVNAPIFASWMVVGEDRLKVDFGQGREEPRAYLRKDYEASSKQEVEAFMNGFRTLLQGLGFVEKAHDSDATVFENVRAGVSVLLHHWKAALVKGINLPDCPDCVPAKKMAELEVDTRGWTIVVRGKKEAVYRGLTNFTESFFGGMAKVDTSGEGVVYSVGYPVQHLIYMDHHCPRKEKFELEETRV